MTREITFVIYVWTCAVVAGGAITALFLGLSGNGEGALTLWLGMTFFAATRGIFSFILFYALTLTVNNYLYQPKIKMFLLAVGGIVICFLNIYLFLFRNKPETFFSFGVHLFVIGCYMLTVVIAVYLFRKFLVKRTPIILPDTFQD